MDEEKNRCLLESCGHYFKASPSESLGECELDEIDQEKGHRPIIGSGYICKHPEQIVLKGLEQTPPKCAEQNPLEEAAKRSNAGHPYS